MRNSHYGCREVSISSSSDYSWKGQLREDWVARECTGAMKCATLFGLTYLCESAFSDMNSIKSQFREYAALTLRI